MKRLFPFVAFLLLLSSPALATPIARIGQTSNYGGGYTSLALTLPTTTGASLLVMHLSAYGNVAVSSGLSSWTEAPGDCSSASGQKMWLYYCYVGTCTTNPTINFSGNAYAVGGIASYSNTVTSGNPFDGPLSSCAAVAY
jgi:hypothetical protein